MVIVIGEKRSCGGEAIAGGTYSRVSDECVLLILSNHYFLVDGSANAKIKEEC